MGGIPKLAQEGIDIWGLFIMECHHPFLCIPLQICSNSIHTGHFIQECCSVSIEVDSCLVQKIGELLQLPIKRGFQRQWLTVIFIPPNFSCSCSTKRLREVVRGFHSAYSTQSAALLAFHLFPHVIATPSVLTFWMLDVLDAGLSLSVCIRVLILSLSGPHEGVEVPQFGCVIMEGHQALSHISI